VARSPRPGPAPVARNTSDGSFPAIPSHAAKFALMVRPKSLRVASIQTESNFLDKDGNLAKAVPLIEEAARKGAVLVLLPELFGGYVYSSKLLWASAEKIPEGKTTQFLCSEAKRLKIHIGATVFEADGEHFYNTFVLAGAWIIHF
jgi:N-carbamoylputrescine amidase